MKKIPLTRGKYAVVDATDYERISKHKWHYMTAGYAGRDVHISYIDGFQKKKKVYMHRDVLNESDESIDHINRDKLDNRRENLRTCSQSVNVQNASLRKDNKTGVKGIVTITDGRKKKYWARIGFNKKTISLGCFATIKEAAEAYSIKAKELYGEHAFIN